MNTRRIIFPIRILTPPYRPLSYSSYPRGRIRDRAGNASAVPPPPNLANIELSGRNIFHPRIPIESRLHTEVYAGHIKEGKGAEKRKQTLPWDRQLGNPIPKLQPGSLPLPGSKGTARPSHPQRIDSPAWSRHSRLGRRLSAGVLLYRFCL